MSDEVSHKDLHDRLVAMENCHKEMMTLLKEVKDDVADTKEIVEAWAVAKGLGKFIKWASGIALGLLAVWAFVKAVAKGVLG